MIDDQIHRNQGIDFLGISTQIFDGIAHGCQIDHRRHAGKVLHQHPRRMIGDLNRIVIFFLPAGNVEQILFFDDLSIHFAQQIFNH